MIIGAILQATSFSYAQMVVARIVTGLGNGLNVCDSPSCCVHATTDTTMTQDLNCPIVSCRMLSRCKAGQFHHDRRQSDHVWHNDLVSSSWLLHFNDSMFYLFQIREHCLLLHFNFSLHGIWQWVDFALFWASGSSAQWRVPIALQIILALVMIGGIQFVRNFHRFLCSQAIPLNVLVTAASISQMVRKCFFKLPTTDSGGQARKRREKRRSSGSDLRLGR